MKIDCRKYVTAIVGVSTGNSCFEFWVLSFMCFYKLRQVKNPNRHLIYTFLTYAIFHCVATSRCLVWVLVRHSNKSHTRLYVTHTLCIYVYNSNMHVRNSLASRQAIKCWMFTDGWWHRCVMSCLPTDAIIIISWCES